MSNPWKCWQQAHRDGFLWWNPSKSLNCGICFFYKDFQNSPLITHVPSWRDGDKNFVISWKLKISISGENYEFDHLRSIMAPDRRNFCDFMENSKSQFLRRTLNSTIWSRSSPRSSKFLWFHGKFKTSISEKIHEIDHLRSIMVPDRRNYCDFAKNSKSQSLRTIKNSSKCGSSWFCIASTHLRLGRPLMQSIMADIANEEVAENYWGLYQCSKCGNFVSFFTGNCFLRVPRGGRLKSCWDGNLNFFRLFLPREME